MYVTSMITIYQRANSSKACENKHWWIFRIKQQSKIQKCIARIMPKVSHERLHGNWSDKVEVEALLFCQLSVAIGNPKVKHFVYACVFVCFLFFYGYKTEQTSTEDTAGLYSS